ncbi:MAG: hypothetical protein ACK47B_22785 [Armatimonadota bacterium]
MARNPNLARRRAEDAYRNRTLHATVVKRSRSCRVVRISGDLEALLEFRVMPWGHWLIRVGGRFECGGASDACDVPLLLDHRSGEKWHARMRARVGPVLAPGVTHLTVVVSGQRLYDEAPESVYVKSPPALPIPSSQPAEAVSLPWVGRDPGKVEESALPRPAAGAEESPE